jgi:hypothetical protein
VGSDPSTRETSGPAAGRADPCVPEHVARDYPAHFPSLESQRRIALLEDVQFRLVMDANDHTQRLQVLERARKGG